MVTAAVLLGVVALVSLVAAGLLLRRQLAASPTAIAGSLDQTNRTLAELQMDLRTIGTRVAEVEARGNALQQGLAGIGQDLTATKTVTTSLHQASESIREGLTRAREGLAAMTASDGARAEALQDTRNSLRRLEAVIAGSVSKGSAGENIVDLLLGQLPAERQARNVQVGNRVVEFGLRLHSGLVVPIDSKWPATGLIEQLAQCEDPAEQLKLRALIETNVLSRANEVAKYIDPHMTAPFAIAVVPDAAYEIAQDTRIDAYQRGRDARQLLAARAVRPAGPRDHVERLAEPGYGPAHRQP